MNALHGQYLPSAISQPIVLPEQAKTLSNGPDGTQDIAHGRDDCALLGGEMLVDFRWRHLTAEGVALGL